MGENGVRVLEIWVHVADVPTLGSTCAKKPSGSLRVRLEKTSLMCCFEGAMMVQGRGVSELLMGFWGSLPSILFASCVIFSG